MRFIGPPVVVRDFVNLFIDFNTFGSDGLRPAIETTADPMNLPIQGPRKGRIGWASSQDELLQ
jgi:hypothetical protein